MDKSKLYGVYVELGSKKVFTQKYFKTEEDCENYADSLSEKIDKLLDLRFLNPKNEVEKVITFLTKDNKTNTALLKNIVQKPFFVDDFDKNIEAFKAGSGLVFDSLEFKIEFPDFDVENFDNDLKAWIMYKQDPGEITKRVFEYTDYVNYFEIK